MDIFANIYSDAAQVIKDNIEYIKKRDFEGLFNEVNKQGNIRLTGAVSKLLLGPIPNLINFFKVIPEYAFALHNGASSIYIPKGIHKIDMFAFYGNLCDEIIIDSNNIIIGKGAFTSCSKLSHVEMYGASEIGPEAFKGCGSLKNMPNISGVTEIKENTFWNCESLEVINIPDGVVALKDGCFGQCRNATEMFIPNSVLDIDKNVIENCYNLTTIYFNGSKSRWQQIKKHGAWRKNCKEQKVICTNGELTLRSRV